MVFPEYDTYSVRGTLSQNQGGGLDDEITVSFTVFDDSITISEPAAPAVANDLLDGSLKGKQHGKCISAVADHMGSSLDDESGTDFSGVAKSDVQAYTAAVETFLGSPGALGKKASAEALRAAKRSFAESLTFPYERMRPFQEEMVDAVGHAVREREALLVSAPTGIGKTIAALYPAVRESLRLGKKLFVLTSKTLQQDAAIKALSMLNDGSFRVLRIRAKQKMCAHTQMICHEDFCPFAAQYSSKMEKSGLLTQIVTGMSYFDPDITFEMAHSNEVCPFEVSLELIEQADVVVCDYNYIFDPYVGLKAYQQENDYGDCVLIVDEAHNLVDRGRAYFSPELSSKSFDAIRSFMAGRKCWVEGWEELIEMLRGHFEELAEILEEKGAGEDTRAPKYRSGGRSLERFRIDRGVDVDRLRLRSADLLSVHQDP